MNREQLRAMVWAAGEDDRRSPPPPRTKDRAMIKPAREVDTYVVTSSQALVRADGRAAILVVTDPLGPVAFEVSLETIRQLRLSLNTAETHLRMGSGQA